MPKHKHTDPLLEALQAGRSSTWTVPDGGDLASMRAAIKHGQTLTMSPVTDPSQVQPGDIVLVRWHKGDIMHLVQEVQGDRFLIANSVGKVNGWVDGSDILGRVTQVVEPPPRPSVPVMLDQLEAACQRLISSEAPSQDDALRLISVVDDLRWYADRVSADRWCKPPRSNKWSFEQNLWHLLKQAGAALVPAPPQAVRQLIDRGKECVGLAAEILALFEPGEAAS